MTFLCGIPLQLLYEVDSTLPRVLWGEVQELSLMQNSHRGSQGPEIKKFALRFFYCAVCLWESQYTNLQYFHLGYISQDIHAINGEVFYMLLVSIQGDNSYTQALHLTWHLLQPPEPWFCFTFPPSQVYLSGEVSP